MSRMMYRVDNKKYGGEGGILLRPFSASHGDAYR